MPRYDAEKDESRHEAVNIEDCQKMAKKYRWELKAVKPLQGVVAYETDDPEADYGIFASLLTVISYQTFLSFLVEAKIFDTNKKVNNL